MPRIDRIHIHNFRGASSPFTIAFANQKPLVVIFGENGTGKTTIVDALDAVGNGSGGSLTTKSSTTLRTHLPTVGKKPSDMVLEVESGATTWTASLTRSEIVTTPAPRPPIRVLRRVNLQRFIDSPPGKRYEELRQLIGVERVERSEEALKRALDAAKLQFDEAVRVRSDAEDQLETIWQAEGGPGGGWRAWAHDAAAADSTALLKGVGRSRATREAITDAVRVKDVWDDAETVLVERRDAVAIVEYEIEESPTLDAAKALQLAEMLGKVREQLAEEGHGDQCPVCGTTIRLSDLRQSLDERLTDLARYQDLSNRLRSVRNRLNAAEEAASAARAQLASAASSLETIASRTPDGFSPLDLPRPMLAAFAASAMQPEGRAAQAAALIAACEPLLASLQAEEDAAVQAAARVNSIRELNARAEESRTKTVELETIVKGLAAAHEVVRLSRIEFTQCILDEVAQECNRLYAQIHPDEGIAISRIELDQRQRASINQAMSFEGHDDIAPQAYLSEAHLDTFGFCFWLAFAKREHPNGDAVLVLDDVFSSVDAPHLSRLTDLIVQERAHFAQVIITTHQREWRESFRNAHDPGNLCDLIELQSWNLAQGIFSYQTPVAIDELRNALRATPFNRQYVASVAGILLESTLDRLTFLYGCHVPRTRDNVYTLNQLLDATSKLLKRLELRKPARDPSGQVSTPPAFETIKPGVFVEQLRQTVYVRNQVGAHHNVQGMAVSDADVRAFANLAGQFVKSLQCETCGQIPSKSTGSHYRCSCSPACAVQMSPLQLV
jgi:DNA repair exonuclease SbcCD ATPase subunit